MTLLDVIEVYNLHTGRDLDDVNAIFKDIEIDDRLDKDILIASIMDECGAMRVIYEKTGTFKYFSDNFFKKYKWNISKLLDTMDLEYNPISNKNWSWTETTEIEQNLDTEEGKEESRTRTNKGTQEVAKTGTQSTTNSGSTTNYKTGGQTTFNSGTQNTTENSTETNTISAMNNDNYQPDSKKVTNGEVERTDDLVEERQDNLTEEREDNLEETREDNLSEVRSDDLSETINANNDRTKNENLTWSETDKHIEEGSDNVIFQDLIEKERKVAQFSIYNWITKKYAHELFLLVY